MSYSTLPADLPVPVDDGAANHLTGSTIPSDLMLPTTTSESVRLTELPGLTILFYYPKTGTPGVPVPDGWDSIPGARGCTPQACSFRDEYSELKKLGVANIFGVSTQDSAAQDEARGRLNLPYDLLSDSQYALVDSMNLPTFEFEGERLIKRMAMAVRNGGKIEKVWYPVFPPGENAAQIMDWLKA